MSRPAAGRPAAGRARALAERAADVLLAPLAAVAALLLGRVRRFGLRRLPATRAALLRAGVLPVRDHYYEPRFRYDEALERGPRDLPGLDLDPTGQLSLLGRLDFGDELETLASRPPAEGAFSFDNPFFGSGDAEILYGILRLFRPRRLYEVGSGQSTLLAAEALRRNRDEGDPPARHLCVEPYENPWLDRSGVEVIRRRVEALDPALFEELESGDVLFIDSSHVIKPGGDVAYLLLEVLPRLRPGVLVHVHDVFTPYHYPAAWLTEDLLLWNEQYLLEGFLSQNGGFEVLAAVYYLAVHHRAALVAACPIYAREAERREPGSFWIRRRGGAPPQTPPR